MEFHPVSGASSSVSFAGDTLILPVVSHGNVGQLATDLLVASLAGRRASGASIIPRCSRASAATRSATMQVPAAGTSRSAWRCTA